MGVAVSGGPGERQVVVHYRAVGEGHDISSNAGLPGLAHVTIVDLVELNTQGNEPVVSLEIYWVSGRSVADL